MEMNSKFYGGAAAQMVLVSGGHPKRLTLRLPENCKLHSAAASGRHCCCCCYQGEEAWLV